MNLRALLLALFVLLAFAAPAFAGGPVFAVVPNKPAPAFADGPVFAVVPNTPAVSLDTGSVGAGSSVQSELTADRQALARARTARRRTTVALARADAVAASAPLLSDQLEAERASAQLQLTSDHAAAEASQLQQQIETLTIDLQPPPTSPFDLLGPATTASATGAEAVSIAKRYLGVPYRWGGADPLSGFDCSGLTMYVYAQLGVQLRHYAADQWNDLPHVDPSQLQPGDLVFFEPRWDGPGHVGIYAGGDSFIEAPHTGDVVKIASLSQEAAALGFVGAARPPAAIGAANPFGY